MPAGDWPDTSSQRSKSSGAITTGARSWIADRRGPAAAVRIVTVSISLPSAARNVSCRPAKAATAPSPRSHQKRLRLPPSARRHS